MRYFLFLFFLTAPGFLLAQDEENPTNDNAIFDEAIRSVQFYNGGNQLTLPIVGLKAGSGSLDFQFDHIGSDIKDYTYLLVHCNSDWQPSELIDNEYNKGFSEDRILQVDVSVNTLINYTHYAITLPNRNIGWTVSGNYLLKVYDNDDDRRLVIVRRFCVVEQVWKLHFNQQTNTAAVEKSNTHQELDFAVTYRGTRIANPLTDVKAFVLQNGRWDNAIGPLKAQFIRNDQLVYDFQDKIVFPAGKEFRFFDIRTLDSRGEWVRSIAELNDRYVVTLRTDQERKGHTYARTSDLNGRYYIDNLHPNQTPLQTDYAQVFFSISRKLPEEDADVYVFGELSDWQLKPEFKMDYDASIQAYICSPLLKQGFYNYQYVVVDKKTRQIELEGFEGNWYETGNLYTVLVYFRTFGDRFDRLMTTISVDTTVR
jgi:hypothetical protein